MVPTTETAKPILKQRKPPADPGPAPFKNVRSPKLINFGEKKKRPTAVRVCPQPPDLLLAAAAAASFSLLRAGPRRSLWLGSRGRSEGRTRARGRASAAGARGGRALAAVRPPRAGGAGCACPGGVWGAGRREQPAGGARGYQPLGSLLLRARTGHLLLPWPPVAARRRRVSTRLGERPPHNGCERRERRVHPPRPGD